MPENQTDNQLYHFSKKVLFLSVLFLLINIAWYALVLYNQNGVGVREVAPKLIFSANQEVLLKTPFDEAYFSAKQDQILLAGIYIKTGDQSFAEIQSEGNIVRLDQNTQLQLLENNFSNPNFPRFVFKLSSGSIWVNAFDPIVVHTPRGQARFAHTVGVYTYSEPLNRIMSIIGNVDLSLFGEDKNLLSQFVVPLKNQVTFTNSQIIPEYSRLEYSKLKKELKMGPISQMILEDDWVERNTKDAAVIFLAENHYIFSSGAYRLKDFYHTLREKLSLIPSQKRIARLNQAKTKLRYLLGGVHENDLDDEAEKLLGEFDELASDLKGDPTMQSLIERQFYVIRNVKTDSPAYAVKENFRERLFTKDNTELLRTYLADLDFLMRADELRQAEDVSEAWLEHWKPGIIKNNFEEFEGQARIYHNIMLAYSSQVSHGLLGVLDETGDYRLENTKNAEETLFEIAMERLEMSKYLVAAYRYADARNYLKTSYHELNLAEKETSAAAREIFLKDATLLADRIAFAEQSLRAAAPIDEKGFLDYLSTQERDKGIEERFTAFLEETRVPEEVVAYPTVDDVSNEFTLARIVVLDEDIEVSPDFPFEFNIKEARLIDRDADGSFITFSAHYDYSTNAIYDIVLNDSPIKGSFALKDFVRISTLGEEAVPVVPEFEPRLDDIADFLNLTGSEEAQRSQIIAQDLAVQLMINELEQFDIIVLSTQQVTVLNPATLSEFKVVAAIIEDTEKNRQLNVSFDYNSVTKILSNITLPEEEGVDISSSQVNADQFIPIVFNALYGKEQEAIVINDTISELRKQNLLIDAIDLILGKNRNQVEFTNVRVKTMPIEFSGVYDRTNKVFLNAEHPLFTAQNTSVGGYVAELSGLFVIDYLSKKGITISKDNIKTPLPNEKVQIKNYVRGYKVLDFTLDLGINRLTDISIQGTDAYVESMTFQEFSLIEGGEAPIEKETEEETEEEEEEA